VVSTATPLGAESLLPCPSVNSGATFPVGLSGWSVTVPEAPLVTSTLGTTGGRTTIDSACRANCAVGWLASVALTVKLAVAAAAGAPVIAPVAALSVSPVGRAPEASEKRYGLTPPLAPTVWL
jgi:hypothetical protein